MIKNFRRQLSKWLQVKSDSDSSELYANQKITFTLYLAEDGFVIQTGHEIYNERCKESEYFNNMYIVSEFDKIGQKVQEILVKESLRNNT
jgi:hypothetical protein